MKKKKIKRSIKERHLFAVECPGTPENEEMLT